ncbi:MAG: NfeD family protein [Cyclobacteriaceae bacterium]
MDLFIVLALIVVGLGLLLVEVIFVPGTTFVGIAGAVSAIIGIYLSFDYFGANVGWWMLLVTALLFGAAIYFGFRGQTWDRFSLKSSIKSKFNEGLTTGLQVAQRGKALSSLRPSGNAEFDSRTFEVRTHGDYIDSGTEVEIIKIDGNIIYVKPIS